jgi:2-desacetyl-2-hydroxyethyl bacteriochlorophyllide A dehydrogenase
MHVKAVQLIEIGKPLELREIARPEPGAGEIRVRVLAAGICHSDAHYRDGTASVGFLPITLGHEIAGVVDHIGPSVDGVSVGDRVALHYLFTCGQCEYCGSGLEQFCTNGRMVGKHANGGYAEYAIAPARNAIPIAESVSPAAAAIMMCSTATAFHALRKARMSAGDRVAVFGAGGLGMSAIQLARACGAAEVFAVDIDAAKLEAAEAYGARSVDPARGAPERQLRDLTRGRGVDVALEFVGIPATQAQAVASLAVQGRVAMAGITASPFEVHSYQTLINREAEIVGVSDHLRGELVTLMDLAQRGLLDLESVIADRVALDADQINGRLDALAEFRGATRSVIVPSAG